MELILKYFPELTDCQRQRFAALYGLYADWNAKINVVSRKDFDQLYLRHVLHSLAIAKVCTFGDGARILDVGCGGGFPSVPLAILFPGAHFTAADSIRKKITVVEGVAAGLAGKPHAPLRAGRNPDGAIRLRRFARRDGHAGVCEMGLAPDRTGRERIAAQRHPLPRAAIWPRNWP